MKEKMYNHSVISEYYCGDEAMSDERVFREALKELFRLIKIDSGIFEASCQKGKEMLTRSFVDYFDRVSMCPEEEMIRKAMTWLCCTHDEVLCSRELILDPTYYCNDFEIKCCSAYILYALYSEAIPILVQNSKSPIFQGSLSILYNCWGEAFDDDFKKLGPRVLSLTEPEERAKAISSINWEYARRQLVDSLCYFCDCPDEIPEVYSDGQIGMRDFGVWRYFHDYRRRLYSDEIKGLSDKDKYDYLTKWCIETMRLGIEIIRDCLNTESLPNDKAVIQDFNDQRLIILMMEYFMTPLKNIMSSLLSNWALVGTTVSDLLLATDENSNKDSLPATALGEDNAEIGIGEPSVKKGYLNFRNLDDDVQRQVYDYLSSRIGNNPGAEDYRYLAALLNMNVIGVPSFKRLRSVFPKYDNDSYYNNFNHYFGESGVYWGDSLYERTRIVDRIEKHMKEIVKGIPALQPFYDTYIETKGL